MLVLLARQWCDAPEDVVQEAFLRLSTQRTEPDRLAAWLYRVVRNAAISAGRAKERRRRHEGRVGHPGPPWFVQDLASRLDSATATNLLEHLPVAEREVIIAHLWGGLTFVEIADLMGSSSSTAHRLFVKGLDELRRKMGEVHVSS